MGGCNCTKGSVIKNDAEYDPERYSEIGTSIVIQYS